MWDLPQRSPEAHAAGGGRGARTLSALRARWAGTPGSPPRLPRTYQVDRVDVTVLVLVVRQDLPQVRDVAGRQPQRVQLGELGVRGHPGQGGLEPGKGLAQHPHAGPLARVGRVSLDLLPLLADAAQGALLGGRLPPLAQASAALLGRPRLAVGALLGALVGSHKLLARVHFQPVAVQHLHLLKVLHIAEGAGGHVWGRGSEREGGLGREGEREQANASPKPVGPRVWSAGQPPRVGERSWGLGWVSQPFPLLRAVRRNRDGFCGEEPGCASPPPESWPRRSVRER